MYYLWSLMSVYTFACIGCVYNATATYVCMMTWQCMLLHQCVHDAWAGLSSVHISLNCLCTTVYVRCYGGPKMPWNVFLHANVHFYLCNMILYGDVWCYIDVCMMLCRASLVYTSAWITLCMMLCSDVWCYVGPLLVGKNYPAATSCLQLLLFPASIEHSAVQLQHSPVSMLPSQINSALIACTELHTAKLLQVCIARVHITMHAGIEARCCRALWVQCAVCKVELWLCARVE